MSPNIEASTTIVDITQILTWPQALVAIVVVFAALIWPTIATYMNSHKTQSAMKEVERKVEITAHEVRPNSGGSLADAVNRIEAAQDVIRAQLSAHLDEAKSRDERIEALEVRPTGIFKRR